MFARRIVTTVWFWVLSCAALPVTGLAAEFNVDLGLHGDNLGQRLSSPPGFAGQVSQLSGFVRARPVVALSSAVFLEPAWGVVVPWRSGHDGFAKVLTQIYELGVGLKPVSWFKWRLGAGLQWAMILSVAREVELNNGAATTVFHTPGGVTSSFVWLGYSGFEFLLSSTVSVGVDAWVSELLSGDRRRVQGWIYLGLVL